MDPVAEIIAARQEASKCHDPHVDVCFLATVTVEGRPEVRAVSLRDIDTKGFGLLLNTTSPKWQQLSAGQCCLHLLWSTVRRQYRVYGHIEAMEPERLQQVEQQATQTAQQAEETARQAADTTANAVSQASIWGFGALLLGAIAAAIGGSTGTRHREDLNAV